MEYQEYLNEKNEMYDTIIEYIEKEEEEEINYYQLTNILETQKICESKDEIVLFLHIIIKICNNHHKGLNFYEKIEKIFQYLFEHIQRYLSNSELFHICKSNKWVVLFLIKNQIINIDEEIAQKIIRENEGTNENYYLFFYPEIKNFLSKEKQVEAKCNINEKNMDEFENKRFIGENDSYICELIRNDSIDDFVTYVHQKNYYLSSIINSSIYETNQFLIENRPSLIEYAAYFGSLQIFIYLKTNNADLNPPLWLYAIHGKNPEIIHHLEYNHVDPPYRDYISCFNESIKCHHNDFANYFKNLLENDDEIDFKPVFKYYNINQIPYELGNNINFYYLCKYNYSKLVELYIRQKQIILQDEAKVFL